MQQAERMCSTEEDCGETEECSDNVCRCPANKELSGVKCLDVAQKKAENNVALILSVSGAFLLIVLQLTCFGCCLFLMAQRAETQRSSLLQQYAVSEGTDNVGDA